MTRTAVVKSYKAPSDSVRIEYRCPQAGKVSVALDDCEITACNRYGDGELTLIVPCRCGVRHRIRRAIALT